jgi:hypothetical protein
VAPTREQRLAAAIAAGYSKLGLAGSVISLAAGAPPGASGGTSAAGAAAPTPLVIPLDSPSSAPPTGSTSSPVAPATSPFAAPVPAIDDDGSPHQRLGEARGAFLARRVRRLNVHTAARPGDERGWRCLVRTQWEGIVAASAGVPLSESGVGSSRPPPPSALRATALAVVRTTLTRAVAACPASAQLQLDRLAVLCDMAALPPHQRPADADSGSGDDDWPTVALVDREWRALLLGAQPPANVESGAPSNAAASAAAAAPFTACSRLWVEYLTWLRGGSGNSSESDGAPARVHAAAAAGIAALVALRATALALPALRALALPTAVGAAADDAASLVTRLCDEAALAILCFVTHYDRARGDAEAATATWQAAFEFACGAPPELSGSADDGSAAAYRRRVAWFAAYWASEAPRVGDVDGPTALASRLAEVGGTSASASTAQPVASSGFAVWFASVTAGLSDEERAAAGLPPRQPSAPPPAKRRSRFTAAEESAAGGSAAAAPAGIVAAAASAAVSEEAAPPSAGRHGVPSPAPPSSRAEPQWGYLGDDETVAALRGVTTQGAVSAAPAGADADDDDDDLGGRPSAARRNNPGSITSAGAAVREVSFYSPLHGYRITARAIVAPPVAGGRASAPGASSPLLLLLDGGDSNALYARLLRDLTRPVAHEQPARSARGDSTGSALTAFTPQLRLEQAASPAHPLSRWLAAEEYRSASETRPLRAVETDPQWYLNGPHTAPAQSQPVAAAIDGWAPVASNGAADDTDSDGDDDDDDERRYAALELAAAALIRGDVTPSSTVPLVRLLPLVYPYSRAGQRELAARFLHFIGVRDAGPAGDAAYGVDCHSSSSTGSQWWDVAFGRAAEEPAAPPLPSPAGHLPVIVAPVAAAPSAMPAVRGVLQRLHAAFPGDGFIVTARRAYDAAIAAAVGTDGPFPPPQATGGGLAATLTTAWRQLDATAASVRSIRSYAAVAAACGASAGALMLALTTDIGALPPGGGSVASALAASRALLSSQASAAMTAVGAITDAWVVAMAALPPSLSGGALRPLAVDAAFATALRGVSASPSGVPPRLGLVVHPTPDSPASIAVVACGAALLDYCRSGAGGAAPDPRGALTILSSALRLALACARTLTVAQLRVAGAYTDAAGDLADAGAAEADAADADVGEYLRALATCGGQPPPRRTSTLAALLLRPAANSGSSSTTATTTSQDSGGSGGVFPLSSPALDALGVPPSPVADFDGGAVDTSTAAGRAVDALLASAELLCAFRVRLLRLHAALVPSSPPRLLRLATQTLACLFPGRSSVAGWSPFGGVSFCDGGGACGSEAAAPAAGWRGIETAALQAALTAHAGTDAPLALRLAPLLGALIAASSGRTADDDGTFDVHAAVARVKRAAQAALQSSPLDAPPAPPSVHPRALPLLWRAVARFHLQAGDPAAAVTTLAAGATACPWSKALALDLLRRGRPYLPPAAIAAALRRARDEGDVVLRVTPPEAP